ncbi:uncharacterized protein LOC130804351 [Amaranthus tricolor]|uniref:uncharacterized protein LOC130804351 n=1 Tax=Amaranthus tricolor TaxID=29722 RepID=UPI00258C911F|nr:uncharacterized protein LOC130804351 [Amaranthus tricolor]
MAPIRPSSGHNQNKTLSLPDFNSLSLSSPPPSISSSSAISAMEDLPLQKVAISGPILSSLINRFSSSPSNIQGLLFGKFSLHTPSSLSDDSFSCSPSPSSLIVSINGFITSGNSSNELSSLISRQHHRQVIGYFSARRKSPLRPSLCEFSISRSLLPDSSPRIFLLLTTPLHYSQTLIHTHEYKVFQFRHDSFEAMPLDVVNVGPAFRNHYSAFSPDSELPCLPCEFRGGSPMREDGKEREEMNSKEMKRLAKDQKDLDLYAKGYEIGSLSRLMGSDIVNSMTGVEELYEKMLAKLDSLARQVETSSAKVLEMDNHNMKLRHKVAGIE